ncbi:epimerase [Microbacterium sp. NPDC077663]|uniref:epimerase n=1 Tax=Microbacterium sp. NPDC077663 TaxID=3364189 RepID=UPI0037C9C583
MSRPRAVVAGAGGFIGEALIAALAEDGYDVVTVGRAAAVTWDDPVSLARAVEGADLLVNLAGKSVDCRYTDRNRDEILRSRVETTRALHDAVDGAFAPPRLWINASTATIYRHTTDGPNTERDGELGQGFSVDVARSWERAFFAGELPRTRRVTLRLAIVVGDGPATRMLLALARTGLGGPQHDGWVPPHRRYRGIGDEPTGGRPPWYRTRGRQRFSWVHIVDVVDAVRFLIGRDDISGPVNVAVPEASDNRTLMRTLRDVVGMPVGLPSLRWMLEIAMCVLRTEPELILKSRWAAPARLLDAGFRFAHTDLRAALDGVERERRLRRSAGRRRRSARS